jgi:hypothetical protein
MSPDKFFEAAFFVSCVALILLVTEDVACVERVKEHQLAKFFMLFVNACNGFFEMAIHRIGLRTHF